MAFNQRNDLKERYRETVVTYVPALKAKILQTTGLALFADTASLDHVITREEIISMTTLLADISEANPEFAPMGEQLTLIADQLSGLTVNEAIEVVLATKPLP